MADVLTFTDAGIHCPAGGFWIDPWRPVDRAVVTHGHSDHARLGMGHYLCTDVAAPVIRHRLGDIALSTLPYGQELQIGDATLSFHPAGHVPGSAQVRVAVGGQVWVVSGDYKVVDDGLSAPFEPVACHAFISECTFGLPIFRWMPDSALRDDLLSWIDGNRADGRMSLIGAYNLGKAQRLMRLIGDMAGTILTHGAVEGTTQVLRDQGFALPPTLHVTPATDLAAHRGAVVIGPPSAVAGDWARRFGDAATAQASGWMTLRGIRRRRGADKGFVVSDHADWAGLNAAIRATGAERVFVTHGYTASFARWLAEQGLDAGIVETAYAGDDADAEVVD